jgi:hypothetical protein
MFVPFAHKGKDTTTDCAAFNEFTSPVFAEYWSGESEALEVGQR